MVPSVQRSMLTNPPLSFFVILAIVSFQLWSLQNQNRLCEYYWALVPRMVVDNLSINMISVLRASFNSYAWEYNNFVFTLLCIVWYHCIKVIIYKILSQCLIKKRLLTIFKFRACLLHRRCYFVIKRCYFLTVLCQHFCLLH